MKCINKMRLLCLCGIAAVFMSGCGQTVVSYDNPYDIYSTWQIMDWHLREPGQKKLIFTESVCGR